MFLTKAEERHSSTQTVHLFFYSHSLRSLEGSFELDGEDCFLELKIAALQLDNPGKSLTNKVRDAIA